MSLPTLCPRCYQSNRLGRSTCWICDGPLDNPPNAAKEMLKANRGGILTVLTISLQVFVAIVMIKTAVALMAVALMLVTCFGLIPAEHIGR